MPHLLSLTMVFDVCACYHQNLQRAQRERWLI